MKSETRRRMAPGLIGIVAVALIAIVIYQAWGNSTLDPATGQENAPETIAASTEPGSEATPDTSEATGESPARGNVAQAADISHDHVGEATWGTNRLEPTSVSEDGLVYEFDINIVETEIELVPGLKVTAWGYNGTVPGPEIRVPEGSYVKVNFTNTHNEPHTIHWHGLPNEQAHDGVLPVVRPGETYTYEFWAHKPGTHFYHCHFDSYRHIDMGMYGPIIIEPKDGPAYGADAEYVMILDDWDSNIDQWTSPWTPNHNYFLVNGRAHPAIPPIELGVDETVLVRFINAGYVNVPMHLHGTHFVVVASDGNPLPEPLVKDTIDIAPGERYDILISGERGAGSFPFHSHNLAQVTNNGSYPGGIHLMVNFVEK